MLNTESNDLGVKATRAAGRGWFYRVVRVVAGLLAMGAATGRAQLNITRQPDALVTVPSGQTATLSVGVTASPAPTYQWRRYGYAIPGATAASYVIPAVSQFHNDFYDVAITSGGTTAVSQTARLLVTLPSYPGAVAVDLPRSLRIEGPEYSSPVNAAFGQAALPDGRFYFCGGFSSIDGLARRDLVRFTAVGTVDPTFTAPAFDVRPQAMALQPDGKLVLVGSFKTVAGVDSSGIVRLNPDGSRDTTFVVGSGFTPAQFSAVSIAPNGSIYVSGSSAVSYQGSAPLSFIARLTPTGALDPTLVGPQYTVGPAGTNPSGFAFGPSGEIYVYGGFDAVNGIPRNRIARLLPSGQVDLTFNPGSGPNNWLYGITVLSNGQVVIGGEFTAYNGTTVGRIARLNTNGTLDPAFATGAGFTGQVTFIAELPGNNLFVGTFFSSYKGATVGAGVRLTANGTLDTTFAYGLGGRPEALAVLPGNRLLVSGGGLDNLRPSVRILEANGSTGLGVPKPELRFPATARLFAALPGGKVFVTGNFTQVNGAPVPYIMRLNADLTRDTTFPAGPGPTTSVTGRVVQPDGKIILFTNNGMMRINADGSTDTTFAGTAPGGYWYNVPGVVLRDGRIFLPTDVQSWEGTTVSNGFVILEADGRRATNHPYLPGPNTGSKIAGVQRLPGGQLLVVGTFTSWNGVGRANAVRLNADGSVDPNYRPDSAFVTSGFRAVVAQNGWSLQRDGRLIAISDDFSSGELLRLNLDGTRDRSFTRGLTVSALATRFLVQPDDRILGMAQGDTPSIDGAFSNVFFRLTPNGGLDSSFVVRGSRFWYDAMLTDSGELISSDGTGYLHRYAALPAPTIAVQPSAASAVAGTNLLLRVTATGDAPLTYQWLKDGVPIAGATSATFALDNTPVSAAGAYTVAVSNVGGTVTSQAAVVTVTPRPVAGVTFGTMAGNAGTFALYIREDGTGAFLAYLRDPQTVFVARSLTVGANRRLQFKTTSNGPTAPAGSSDVDGAIAADGTVSGTLFGRALTAPAAPTSGATSALVGFYEAGELNGSGLSYTIVGANGVAYTVAVGTGLAEAGSATIDPAGVLAGTTETAAHMGITGTVQAATGLTTNRWQRPTGPLITFVGADNEKRNDVEKLVNISTRSTIGAGGAFTAGFVVLGDRSKPMLVRAIGPSLGIFQVDGALPAARLEVFRGSTSIAVGNDWGQGPNAAGVAATAVRVGAFALPLASRDAAVLVALEPGAYSARVTGQEGATGVALVEIYDATEGPIPRSQRIINVSTLASVGAGGGALTAGFVVSGTVPKRLLIRGAGPALTPFGVGEVLARPQLAVYSGSTVLAQNAGWSTSADAGMLATAATQVGAFAFPAGSADAALVLNLAPGPYSAQVTGVGGATGAALVEVYELP